MARGADQEIDDDEPVANMGKYRQTRRRLEREREEKAALQAELNAIKAREAKAKQDEHWSEFEALKQFKAEAEKREAERARESIRNRNADAILSDVKQERRDEITVLLAGMQALGKIDLYQEAEDAGLRLRETLGKDHPDWFSDAPNGAVPGMPGIPGQGLPQGPVIGMTPEQYMQLSEEQRTKLFERQPHKGANP